MVEVTFASCVFCLSNYVNVYLIMSPLATKSINSLVGMLSGLLFLLWGVTTLFRCGMVWFRVH